MVGANEVQKSGIETEFSLAALELTPFGRRPAQHRRTASPRNLPPQPSN